VTPAAGGQQRAPACRDGAVRAALLLALLSTLAGSLDVIGLLELGLFTSHITGNLALLIVHVIGGGAARVGPLLAFPVFVATLVATRMLMGSPGSIGPGTVRLLLGLELLLLAGCLAARISAGPSPDPEAATTIVAGMIGVAAMAVQNALVSVRGAPQTTVMTTNVTHLTLDLGELLLGRDSTSGDKARLRAGRTWPVVAGFAVGCGLGAACLAALGRWSLAVPVGLAVLALAMASDSTSRAGAGNPALPAVVTTR